MNLSFCCLYHFLPLLLAVTEQVPGVVSKWAGWLSWQVPMGLVHHLHLLHALQVLRTVPQDCLQLHPDGKTGLGAISRVLSSLPGPP